MKFRATDDLNVRQQPAPTAAIVTTIPKGTVVDGDAATPWKSVTLVDGRKGFCSAQYLQPAGAWSRPIRADKFKITQAFLAPDAVTYPRTGHHPGVDYGTQGEDGVQLYYVADGEVIESGVHAQFGNYFFFYVPEVDRTFVYFHLKGSAPAKGQKFAAQVAGICGTTGLSYGIHLHLECMKGKKTSSDRAALYTSFEALKAAAEDADVLIRSKLA